MTDAIQDQGVPAAPSGHSPKGGAASSTASPAKPSVPNAACEHLPDFAGEVCAGCGDEIDSYGNTENDFKFCSFPDCGCDGARLCMAGSASDDALGYNVEGMYSMRDPRPRLRFIGAVYSGKLDRAASAIEARRAATTGAVHGSRQ